MNLFTTTILEQAQEIADQLATLPIDERIAALNAVRNILHHASPFANEPVDCVQWVRAETVTANDYNPNAVASPEMRLLERSILQDGYTQPIVGMATESGVETVDGFHRGKIGKESKAIRTRIHGYLPVALIRSTQTDKKDRIAATIRHNRARGVHAVMPMTDIVADLIRQGSTDAEIANELGMDADEVLRFKQVKGLPALFKDHSFSKAWE